MEDSIKRAVERVIQAMRENLSEQNTIDEMARTALFSKFHFSRIFQRVTGISPGRFLAAMRLQKAKDLLVSTSLSVTEITHEVGYASVGTFSARFSSSVGVSPSTYRRLGGFYPRIFADDPGGAEESCATIHGEVCAPDADHAGLVVIGLFPGPVPEGRPGRCAILAGPGPYTLNNVPRGTWHLLAYSVAGGRAASVGCHGPLTIRSDTATAPRLVASPVQLRPMAVFDPPILLALPDLRSLSL